MNVLDVFLNDIKVGSIVNDKSDRNTFIFDAAYVSNESRPTLGQRFFDDDGALIVDNLVAKTKLPPYFSNLLPEGVTRRTLAENAGVNSDREFPMLWLTGGDLPGALNVRSPDGPTPPAESGALAPDDPKTLRFSLAGVQLKFSGLKDGERLMIPAQGMGGEWIVKFPDSRFSDVPRVEYAMMRLAAEIGIDVPSIGLVQIDRIEGLPRSMRLKENTAYYIQRFDRTEDGKRVHTEDFAQIFDLYPTKEGKYNSASFYNIANVIHTLLGMDGLEEFVRRLVFNFLIGNADMHVKNWSLIYPDGRTPKLAPAYDYVSTILYLPDDANFGLSLVSGVHAWSELSMGLFDRFSDHLRVPRGRVRATVRDTIDRFVPIWSTQARDLDLTRSEVEQITAHMQALPIVSGLAHKRPRGDGRARQPTLK